MKQHITLTQWDEITREQKQILWKWGYRKDWRINIGQMIEFLGNDVDMIFKETKWNVVLDLQEYQVIKKFKQPELCDALWEAVKYKLTK